MSGLLGCFGVCLVCGLFGFLRGVHCELVYSFCSLFPSSSILSGRWLHLFEVFFYVEFDLKGAFALLFVVFVSYKFSVLWSLMFVKLCFACVFLKGFFLHCLCLSLDPPLIFFTVEVFGVMLCHVVRVCLSLFRPPYTGGGLGRSFQVVFWKISLKTVYPVYKNVSKCTEVYENVRKCMEKVEKGGNKWKSHKSCDCMHVNAKVMVVGTEVS